MAEVAYISAGEAATAEKMNLLFDAFNEKLGKILLQRSPILAFNVGTGGIPRELFGKFFFFTGDGVSLWAHRCPGAKVKSTNTEGGVFLYPYDHVAFKNAEARISGLIFDEANSIVDVDTIPSNQYVNGIPFGPGRSIFDESLSCHVYHRPTDGKGFYIREKSMLVPQKHYRYALAEIVLEGKTSVDLGDHLDKYNCFRIHNLNYGAATVTFGKNISFGVQALGCITVRRDQTVTNGKAVHSNYRSVGGARGNGGYFFTYETGDYRHYWMLPNSGGARDRTYDNANNSMEGNNLCSPSIIFDWVRQLKYDDLKPLLAEQTRYAWFHPDPHIVQNIYPDYSTLFGDPGFTGTRLGDLLHHKGKIILVKYHKTNKLVVNGKPSQYPDVQVEEFEFRGYDTIVADFAAKNIVLTEDAVTKTYVISQGADANWEYMLIPYSTNLFKQGENWRSFLDLRQSHSIEGVVFDTQQESLIMQEHGPQILNKKFSNELPNQPDLVWKSYDAYFQNGNRNSIISHTVPRTKNRQLYKVVNAPIGGERSGAAVHQVRVSDILDMSFFWNKNESLLFPPSEWAQYGDMRLVLTPQGLQLLFNEQVPSKIFNDAKNDLWLIREDDIQFDSDRPRIARGWFQEGEYFKRKRVITFRGHGFGWPQLGRINTMFHSPRVGRMFLGQDKILDDIVAPGGEDYKIQDPSAITSDIKTLNRVLPAYLGLNYSTTTEALNGRFWDQLLIGDALHAIWEAKNQGDEAFKLYLAQNRAIFGGSGRPAFPLLHEHYNAMAMSVNQQAAGKTLDIRSLRFPTNVNGVPLAIGIKPLTNEILINIWGGNVSPAISYAPPVPIDTFDCYFDAGTANDQARFNLYRSVGIPIRDYATLKAYEPKLETIESFEHKDLEVTMRCDANVSGSVLDTTLGPQGVEPGSPTSGWYLSDVHLDVSIHSARLVSKASFAPTSPRYLAKGSIFIYTAGFINMKRVYGGIQFVVYSDIINWISQFGFPFANDEIFQPFQVKIFEPSAAYTAGPHHTPSATLSRVPTVPPSFYEYVVNSRRFRVNDTPAIIDKSWSDVSDQPSGPCNISYYHMAAFAPATSKENAKWKAVIPHRIVRNVKFWKDKNPAFLMCHAFSSWYREPAHETFDRELSASPTIVRMETFHNVTFFDPFADLTRDPFFTVSGNPIDGFGRLVLYGGNIFTSTAWTRTGAVAHYTFGDPTDEDFNLWLQMNWGLITTLGYRVASGTTYATRPGILLRHRGFWRTKVDDFGSHKEKLFMSIQNYEGSNNLPILNSNQGTFFDPALKWWFVKGESGPLNGLFAGQSAGYGPNELIWEEGFNETLSPVLESGVNVINAPLNKSYYLNVMSKYSSIAL